MLKRIYLDFESFEDKELKRRIGSYKIIRLKTSIRFKTLKGFTGPFDAIVDTGAHTTLIPLSIWKRILARSIMKSSVQGIAAGPECSIPVILGKVSSVLTDEFGNSSKESEIIAYLALTDETPLIVGFKDLLQKYDVYFSYRKRKAYLEI